MGKKPQVKIGDIFEIPISDNRKAFGQYVYFDQQQGPLIQIFDYILKDDEKVDLNKIVESKKLFPPIITGLFAAIRAKLWKVVGNKDIENFVYPGFVSTLRKPKTNEATIWFYWNGSESIRLGRELSKEYKEKEYLAIHSPYDIPERIETGKNPYEEIIMTNKFSS